MVVVIVDESGVVNGTEFRVVGMSRSGNQAIINWIISQARGRLCFLNCAEPKTNPFFSARPLPHGRPYIVNYPDFDIEQERSGVFSEKDYLIHSYEDCFLGTLRPDIFETRHDAWLGASRQRVDVLILRDPFNLFASRRKAGYGLIGPDTARRIWKQHAREFLDKRRYLQRTKVGISYNAWVRDDRYRCRLANRLGLTFTDAGFRRASHFGSGSTFDNDWQHAYDMPVLQRWRHFQDNPAYRRLFEPQLAELARRIFGTDPEIECSLLDHHKATQ